MHKQLHSLVRCSMLLQLSGVVSRMRVCTVRRTNCHIWDIVVAPLWTSWSTHSILLRAFDFTGWWMRSVRALREMYWPCRYIFSSVRRTWVTTYACVSFLYAHSNLQHGNIWPKVNVGFRCSLSTNSRLLFYLLSNKRFMHCGSN